MDNLYKDNWEDTRQRFQQWWSKKEMDRPLLLITAPRPLIPSENREITKSEAIEDRYLNIDSILNRQEYIFSRLGFYGENIPYVFPYLGPGSVGTFLGAQPVFAEDTVWYEPCFHDISNAQLNLQRDSKWWQWTIDFTKVAVDRSRGRYLVTTPDLVENLDTLAAIFGTEKLLYYLVDAPGEVHRLQRELLTLWFEIFDELYSIIADSKGWSGSVFTLWGPGKTAKLQCDISAMLSPSMFNEFVLPYLKKQSDRLDNTVYHLDGPSAICHLDSILSIDSLNCVQWSPGAGKPDAGDPCWDGLYRKVLEAGKCILTWMEPRYIKDFQRRFGKTAISIMTDTSSEKEAFELIDTLK